MNQGELTSESIICGADLSPECYITVLFIELNGLFEIAKRMLNSMLKVER